jgi:hypothetical protein
VHQRGVRHLGVVVVIIVLALAAGGAEAHHGSQADCTGAGVCRPNGVFTITWSNSNPSACRFDVTVTWGDGSSSFVPDVRTGQSTSHTYTGHGLFTASTSAVVTGANCTFSAGSAVIEVPSPPAPPPPPPPPPSPPPSPPPTCAVDADPIAVGCQSPVNQVNACSAGEVDADPITAGCQSAVVQINACGNDDFAVESSLVRRLHDTDCFTPVRTATARPDGTATAPGPRPGTPARPPRRRSPRTRRRRSPSS